MHEEKQSVKVRGGKRERKRQREREIGLSVGSNRFHDELAILCQLDISWDKKSFERGQPMLRKCLYKIRL